MKKVHFIGIGGIGVSALAQYYLKKEWQVSGSDLKDSEITRALQKKGAQIFIGPHKKENLKENVKKVIYTLAATPNNPELKKAKELRIEIQSYPQALGELTKEYFTIAVCGTHGKSTTCAMIAKILIEAGFDPTVFLGTKLKEFGDSNFKDGKSKYLLIEADEWQRAFLNYWPKIVVLTNIEKEHLDCYKDLKDILQAYKEFITNLPEKGVLVANEEDENVLKLKNQISKPKFKTQFFSSKQKEIKIIKEILKIPGKHNLLNALAALTTARILKIPDKVSFQALSQYQGAWRRFEIKKIKKGKKKIYLISDYAHHPTEIEATLKAIREKFGQKKLAVIFQPHQYQRTYYLFDEFLNVFSKNLSDFLVITDIFEVAGREKEKIYLKISPQDLVFHLKKKNSQQKIEYFSRETLLKMEEELMQEYDIFAFLGAGDIYLILEKWLEIFSQENF